MRFLKRLSALLLAMLSLCSLVACKEEIVIPDAYSEVSSETSSSEKDWSKYPFAYFINDDEVDFQSTLSADRKSVLIDATPLFDVSDLKIQTTFLFSNNEIDSHINSFENAPAGKTLSFRVYLSDSLIKEGKTIEFYDYTIIGGVYGDIHSGAIRTTSSSNPDDNYWLTFSFDIAEDRKSVLINIKPKLNLYELKFEIYFNLSTEIFNNTTSSQVIILDFLPKEKIWSTRIYFPKPFLSQNLLIDTVYVKYALYL